MHLQSLSCEEHAGLPRRVAPTHHHDALAARTRLHLGRRVEDARAFELLEPGHLEAPVAGAGSEHDRPRVQLPPADQLEHVEAAHRLERLHLRAHQDGGGELLGLKRGAGGELLARQAGRESEVVLDSRRRACLPADGDRFDDDGGQALASRVHGRGKPRGTGADDDEVARVLYMSGRRLDAEHRRHLGQRWILEHGLPGHQDDGDVVRRETEVPQQLLRPGVGFDVEPGDADAVAGEKVEDLARRRAVARADDLGPRTQAHQERVTQEEGAQHDLTERHLRADDVAQAVERDLEDATRDEGGDRNVGALGAEDVHHTDELAGLESGGDRVATRSVVRDRLQLTVQHDDEIGVDLALAEDDLSRFHLRLSAIRAEARDLRLVEDREGSGEVGGVGFARADLQEGDGDRVGGAGLLAHVTCD